MATARGIRSIAGYLPHWRLDRSEVAAVAGGGGGRGTRTVAGYDEDTTTMGVEAARAALASDPGGAGAVDTLWFSTVQPAYADKTNATALHAALRLASTAGAYDANGSVRAGIGALRAALDGRGTHLVVTSDLRTGLAGGPDESAFGDGAAAAVVGDGDGDDGPLLAELVGASTATEELLDRWRAPGALRSQQWEERFGETRYVPLGQAAWDDALKAAGLVADQVDRVVITGTHARACTATARRLGVGERLVDDLAGTVGTTGAAHPLLLLARTLEDAAPGEVVALVVLADGADVLLLRTTEAVAGWAPTHPVAEQAAGGAALPYGTYLRWRGILPVEPPRRPEPARPSASAAARSRDWKFGFVGSADDAGEVHLPPRADDASSVAMADAEGTIVTFTVDRLASSPSPPIVFAVVDFDGGGRLPVELTDVDLDRVRTGARVALTFRRLFTADGIHNYFWKARLVGPAAEGESG